MQDLHAFLLNYSPEKRSAISILQLKVMNKWLDD